MSGKVTGQSNSLNLQGPSQKLDRTTGKVHALGKGILVLAALLAGGTIAGALLLRGHPLIDRSVFLTVCVVGGTGTLASFLFGVYLVKKKPTAKNPAPLDAVGLILNKQTLLPLFQHLSFASFINAYGWQHFESKTITADDVVPKKNLTISQILHQEIEGRTCEDILWTYFWPKLVQFNLLKFEYLPQLFQLLFFDKFIDQYGWGALKQLNVDAVITCFNNYLIHCDGVDFFDKYYSEAKNRGLIPASIQDGVDQLNTKYIEERTIFKNGVKEVEDEYSSNKENLDSTFNGVQYQDLHDPNQMQHHKKLKLLDIEQEKAHKTLELQAGWDKKKIEFNLRWYALISPLRKASPYTL